MRILGISAFYHDSAAALVRDGEIIAAAQEERFTRKKHDAGFPRQAIDYCLRQDGIQLDDVDYVVFYDKPFLKFERLLETYLGVAPRGVRSFTMAMPIWLQEKLFQKDMLQGMLVESGLSSDRQKRLLFTEHHVSHAASAFFPSPFEEALVLTMDGVGEWATTSVAIGRGNHLSLLREIHFPHSLGLLYSAFTYYTGFKVNSGEYKLMGLAPYGVPRYANMILDNVIDVKPDGSFRLNMGYFNYTTGLTMTSERLHALFGGPARKPGALLTQDHMDIAASIQAVLEEVVLRMTRSLASETGQQNLCLAGGVALNCVANGRILRDGRFKNIFVQPASGDAGGSLGAALAGYYMYQQKPRTIGGLRGGDLMKGSYLGPEFTQQDIEQRLRTAQAKFTVLSNEQLIAACVQALTDEEALGWFQGRMEFGPRALGGRSILADARSPRMQAILNLKVKFRESFRPFAPSILREDVADWFDLDGDSPYMLLVADVAKKRRFPMTPDYDQLFGVEKLNVPRSEIPAVTHVDYSARVQTVHQETNARYYALLQAFKGRTGCPVLVNTSFNVRGEPIVGTPEDAFRCFMGSGIEALAVGNCFMRKEEQDPALALSYQNAFTPD